jgi:RNA polymerase sigma-70 factor (ECF subfamily)
LRETDPTRLQEELFTQLFRQYAARVFHYFKKHVKQDEQAEDLTQEVFSNIWQKMDHLYPDGAANATVDAYLFTAARNHLYNYLKKALKEDRCFTAEPMGSAEQAVYSHIEEQLEEKERKVEYGTILDTLPQQQLRAFELSREYNLSYHEIASTMGIAPRTVEKHIAAAIKTFRRRMTALTVLFSLFIIW